MGILGRAKRAISANVHALTSKREEEAEVLRQIEVALAVAKRDIIAAVAAEKSLRARRDELRRKVDGWEERALRAIDAGEDALAREALDWKRRAGAELEATEAQRTGELARAIERRNAMRALEAKREALAPKTTEAPRSGEVDYDLLAMKTRMREEEVEASIAKLDRAPSPARVRVEPDPKKS